MTPGRPARSGRRGSPPRRRARSRKPDRRCRRDGPSPWMSLRDARRDRCQHQVGADRHERDDADRCRAAALVGVDEEADQHTPFADRRQGVPCHVRDETSRRAGVGGRGQAGSVVAVVPVWFRTRCHDARCPSPPFGGAGGSTLREERTRRSGGPDGGVARRHGGRDGRPPVRQCVRRGVPAALCP